MEKRLLLAQKMIRDGEKPTTVCERCGFGDYTTFYRNYIAFWGTRENETQPRFLHVISLPLSQINGHIACIKLSHTNCLDITHLDEYINEFKKNSNDTRVYPNYTRKCNEKWKDMKEISNAMLESHEKLKKVVLDYIWLVKFLMEKNQEFDFKKVDFENWEKSVNVDNK